MKHMMLFSVILTCFHLAWADNAKWMIHEYPFQHTLNMNDVHEVTQLKPKDLVKYIQSKNIDILVVKTSTKSSKLKLKLASPELLRKIEFDDATDGMMISKDNKCCSMERDTIIVKDVVDHYTLLHEYLHVLIQTKGRGKERIGDQFQSAHRTLDFRLRKVIQDSIRLTERNWRRDILNSSKDYVDLLYAKIQESQSQEALIEKILSQYIDSKNPFYSEIRQKEGLQYGENSINNAIDLFNYIHQVINMNLSAVQRLRGEIERDELLPEYSQQLSAEETEDFIKKSNSLLAQLEITKTEILKLKSFYK